MPAHLRSHRSRRRSTTGAWWRPVSTARSGSPPRSDRGCRVLGQPLPERPPGSGRARSPHEWQAGYRQGGASPQTTAGPTGSRAANSAASARATTVDAAARGEPEDAHDRSHSIGPAPSAAGSGGRNRRRTTRLRRPLSRPTRARLRARRAGVASWRLHLRVALHLEPPGQDANERGGRSRTLTSPPSPRPRRAPATSRAALRARPRVRRLRRPAPARLPRPRYRRARWRSRPPGDAAPRGPAARTSNRGGMAAAPTQLARLACAGARRCGASPPPPSDAVPSP